MQILGEQPEFDGFDEPHQEHERDRYVQLLVAAPILFVVVLAGCVWLLGSDGENEEAASGSIAAVDARIPEPVVEGETGQADPGRSVVPYEQGRPRLLVDASPNDEQRASDAADDSPAEDEADPATADGTDGSTSTTEPGATTSSSLSSVTTRTSAGNSTPTTRATSTTERATTTTRRTTTTGQTTTTTRVTTTATTAAPTTAAPTTAAPTTAAPTTQAPTTPPPTTAAPTTTTTTTPPTTAPPTTSGNNCNSGGEFERIFRDDFNGSSVSNDWVQYHSTGNAGYGLRRHSANTVSNGNLVITASMQNGTLVSGGMASRIDMAYGKYVARVRTDNDWSQGTSGVLLTWPTSGVHPRDGENNFYETLAQTGARNPFFTFIHKPYGTVHDQEYKEHHADGSQFQIMTMEWTPSRITIIREGPGGSSYRDVWTVNETGADLIPDVSHHLAIQLDGWAHSISDPVRMEVDYVEIYKYCY